MSAVPIADQLFVHRFAAHHLTPRGHRVLIFITSQSFQTQQFFFSPPINVFRTFNRRRQLR